MCGWSRGVGIPFLRGWRQKAGEGGGYAKWVGGRAGVLDIWKQTWARINVCRANPALAEWPGMHVVLWFVISCVIREHKCIPDTQEETEASERTERKRPFPQSSADARKMRIFQSLGYILQVTL